MISKIIIKFSHAYMIDVNYSNAEIFFIILTKFSEFLSLKYKFKFSLFEISFMSIH